MVLKHGGDPSPRKPLVRMRLWIAVVVLAIQAAGVAAAPAAGTPTFLLFVGVSSRAMVTAVVEPRLCWERGLGGKETVIAGRVEIPAFLVAAGEFDTFALTLEGTQELVQDDESPASAIAARWSPSFRLRAGFGLDSQVQSLGHFAGLTASTGADLGLSGERGRIGVSAEWKQTLATHWSPGSDGSGTLGSRKQTAGSAGWFYADRGRLSCGVTADWAVSSIVHLEGEVLGVRTPGPFVHGFDGMMIGQWPFSCLAGACVAVPSGH